MTISINTDSLISEMEASELIKSLEEATKHYRRLRVTLLDEILSEYEELHLWINGERITPYVEVGELDYEMCIIDDLDNCCDDCGPKTSITKLGQLEEIYEDKLAEQIRIKESSNKEDEQNKTKQNRQ